MRWDVDFNVDVSVIPNMIINWNWLCEGKDLNFLYSPSPKTILGSYFKEWGYEVFSEVG
jgi:hypothetical protein